MNAPTSTIDPLSAPPPLYVRMAGPLSIVLVGVAMAMWVWDKGPDPLVDFGREMYVAWRLSEGEVLYRDIHYFNGPLSPYLNSVVFRVFGVSLAVLKMANTLVIGLATALVYHLARRISDRVAATSAAIMFLVLSAFAYLVQSGNYSFLTPYSHELPHGITLSLAAIACVDRWCRSGRRIWCAAAGVLLGMTFLTKAEVFLAAGAGLVVGVALVLWVRRPGARSAAITMTLFVVSAMTPIAIAFALMLRGLSPQQSAEALAGSWAFLGNKALMQLPYFKDMNGMADLGGSLRSIGMMSLWWAACAAPGVAAGLLTRRRGGPARSGATAVGVVVGLAIAIAIWLQQPSFDLEQVARPLPLAMLLSVAGIVARLWRCRNIRSNAMSAVLPFTLAVFAGTLLLKMLFNVRLVHYGFALAMPATMVLSVLCVGWLADWVHARGGSGPTTKAAMLVILVAVLLIHLNAMNETFLTKTRIMAAGTGDTFRVDEQGWIAERFVQSMKQSSRPDQTLVMMPDGTMANYLARRLNPSTHLQFTPPAMIMYGEQRMLSDLQRRPPDFIGIINQDCGVYGARFLGINFGVEIMKWVKENYSRVGSIGASVDEPGVLGGITLFRRNETMPRDAK